MSWTQSLPVNCYGTIAQQCTGKRWRLPTRKAARALARQIGGLRPYRCRICGMWHLTKADDDASKS